MAITFIWNDRELSVDSKMIKSFSDWNLTASYMTEQKGEAKGDKPAKTKSVGPENGTLSITVILKEILGVDVKTEVLWWRQQCNSGTTSNIYVGNFGAAQLGEYKWMLTDITQSDLRVMPDGTWTECTLSLTFEENYEKVKLSKLEKKQKKLAKKLEKQQAKMAKQILKGKDTSKIESKIAKTAQQYNDVTIAVAKAKAETYKANYAAKKKTRDLTASYFNAGVYL